MERLRTASALCAAAILMVLLGQQPASAQGNCVGGPTLYTCTDENAFLAKLSEVVACSVVHEGFEDDAAWDSSRFPATQPSVESQGIIWMPNNSTGGISTGNGAARSGSYGAYAYPHGIVSGDAFALQRDGVKGYVSGTGMIFGVGGWIVSNTPGARVRFVADAQDIGFEDSAVGVDYRFWGVIHTAGFSDFEVYESEGRIEDQKLIFADDFSICIGAFQNSAPVAESQHITTPVATPASVFLSAEDPNGDLLTYTVVAPPLIASSASAAKPFLYSRSGLWRIRQLFVPGK